jgi:hypothetical protein
MKFNIQTNTQEIKKYGYHIALYKAFVRAGYTKAQFFEIAIKKSAFYRHVGKLEDSDKAEILGMESRIHDHIQSSKEEIMEKVDSLSAKVKKIYDVTVGKYEKKAVNAERKLNAVEKKYAEITTNGTQEQKNMMHAAIEYHLSIANKFKNKDDYSKKKVVESYDAIRLLIDADKQSLNTICNVLDFILVDEFWHDKVKAISSLRTISKNGQKKYFNVLTAMNNAINRGLYVLTDYFNGDNNN